MTDRVSFQELRCRDNVHKIGVATLDNPASLNALSYNMLALLFDQLLRWQHDDNLVCILLEGGGEKAFCAGGDVRTMHNVMRDKSDEEVQAFCTEYFSLEYQCDYLIHTYTKPIIAWGDGIVMGGGMGLFMGCSHKVVTPRSRLAMPEISIGLYPDVGGTWFLNRLPPGIGLFLGLTGASVNAIDAIDIRMADYLLHYQDRSPLLSVLQALDWQGNHRAQVSRVLDELAAKDGDDGVSSQLLPYLAKIQSASKADTLTQVCEQILAIEGQDKWMDTARRNLAAGSPISAHICYRQITQCQKLSLADCFRLELSLSVRSGLLGEFQEGVRARLIDKDGEPHWTFKSVASVDDAVIDQLFTSLWPAEIHPLAGLEQVHQSIPPQGGVA
ncbi:enoyl-CoA hydratase/isomerase family protein [Vibrio sp. CDRSL-10 TSBA]